MPLVSLAREEQAVQAAAAQSADTARGGRGGFDEDRPRSGTFSTPSDVLPPSPAPLAPQPAAQTATNNLDGITKYIPAETIALYLAFLPAVSGQGTIAGILLILALAAFTVIFYVLVTMTADQQLPEKPALPPLKRKKVRWNLGASLVCYVVWALAIPGNPAIDAAQVSPVLVSPLALLISTILTQLESAFGINKL